MDNPSSTSNDGKSYCICGQNKADDLIGCDNDKCEVEWYHIGCVGLTESTTKKNELWFCPACTNKLKNITE